MTSYKNKKAMNLEAFTIEASKLAGSLEGRKKSKLLVAKEVHSRQRTHSLDLSALPSSIEMYLPKSPPSIRNPSTVQMPPRPLPTSPNMNSYSLVIDPKKGHVKHHSSSSIPENISNRPSSKVSVSGRKMRLTGALTLTKGDHPSLLKNDAFRPPRVGDVKVKRSRKRSKLARLGSSELNMIESSDLASRSIISSVNLPGSNQFDIPQMDGIDSAFSSLGRGQKSFRSVASDETTESHKVALDLLNAQSVLGNLITMSSTPPIPSPDSLQFHLSANSPLEVSKDGFPKIAKEEYFQISTSPSQPSDQIDVTSNQQPPEVSFPTVLLMAPEQSSLPLPQRIVDLQTAPTLSTQPLLDPVIIEPKNQVLRFATPELMQNKIKTMLPQSSESVDKRDLGIKRKVPSEPENIEPSPVIQSAESDPVQFHLSQLDLHLESDSVPDIIPPILKPFSTSLSSDTSAESAPVDSTIPRIPMSLDLETGLCSIYPFSKDKQDLNKISTMQSVKGDLDREDQGFAAMTKLESK